MKDKICIVCNEAVDLEEYKKIAPPLKPYPVHPECFNTFVNADEFLEFAREQKKSKYTDPLIDQPADVSPS